MAREWARRTRDAQMREISRGFYGPEERPSVRREREIKKTKKKREEWMNVKLFLSVLKGARARAIIIAF